MGGLGVIDLDIMNFCLLCKWTWKLENEKGVWQTLVREKYLKKCTFRYCKKKNGQSHFWWGLMKVRTVFLQYSRKMVGNGERTMFWSDVWLGDKPLSVQFPRLFLLIFSANFTVAKALSKNMSLIRFR